MQRAPDPIARDEGHTANRPNPGFEHGLRQGCVHLDQIAGREEGNISRLDGLRRERLLERNRPSVVDVRLPFQSVSIEVRALAIRVQQAQDGPVVARDVPNTGKNRRQQFLQLQDGTQFSADGDQALLFLKGAVGAILLQHQRPHQRDPRE